MYGNPINPTARLCSQNILVQDIKGNIFLLTSISSTDILQTEITLLVEI